MHAVAVSPVRPCRRPRWLHPAGVSEVMHARLTAVTEGSRSLTTTMAQIDQDSGAFDDQRDCRTGVSGESVLHGAVWSEMQV